jgi:hypothetical protein
MTKIEALAELRSADHGFLNQEGCDHIAAPFGLTPQTYRHKADYTHPKGLWLRDGAKSAVGLAAEELAAQICAHLGLGNPGAAFSGRGSALRACCDAIEKSLEQKNESAGRKK